MCGQINELMVQFCIGYRDKVIFASSLRCTTADGSGFVYHGSVFHEMDHGRNSLTRHRHD